MSRKHRYGHQGGRNDRRSAPLVKEDDIRSWIKNGLSREAISFSQDVGEFLEDQSFSSSQIRNVFGEVKRIQMKGFSENSIDFLLLKPKIAYTVSRQQRGRQNEASILFKQVFDAAHSQVDEASAEGPVQFQNFVDLLESVLAYHKAAGGK